MEATYVHHSGYLVELENVDLLFDYTQGELPKRNPDKALLVFVSHRHGDHFSPVIFSFMNRYRNVCFVISDDIWQRNVPDELFGVTIFVDSGQEKTLLAGSVKVETFKSTDEGVAFLVNTEGKCIYHAGDLNNWVWPGEGDSWNESMNEKYQQELAKLRGREIDVAFLPLDPRQGEWFYRGIDDFMKQVSVKVLFPMHFWDDFEVIEKLKKLPCAQAYRDKIMEPKKSGQKFFL